MSFVQPRVFRTGYTEADMGQIIQYLEHTKQQAFLDDIQEAAMLGGISGAECLCSMYAKLCYKSLVLGKNANLKSVRSIPNNLVATFDSGHGSVFEHVGFSFICTDVSRVFTHELVRHRAGTAFSQTSGRYCRPVPKENGQIEIDFVHDPILNAVKDDIEATLLQLAENYQAMERKLGLMSAETAAKLHTVMIEKLNADAGLGFPMHETARLRCERLAAKLASYQESPIGFDQKKKLTSALRRILPNGQANEIAFSCNIRTLRHCVQIRTQRFAEWEIRNVFAQIYGLVKEKFPMVFYGAKERMVDGLPEVYNMKLQPYDLSLPSLPAIELLEEVRRRKFKFDSNDQEKKFVEAINSPLAELNPAA